jgi:hypothetical protein
MAITLLLPPGVHVKLLNSKQIVCTDPDHMHRSPLQNMATFLIEGHIVEVTEEGYNNFNARIDGGVACYDLTAEQLDIFIKDNLT